MPEPVARAVSVTEVAPNRRRGGDIRVVLSPRTVGSTSGFMGVLTLRPGEFVAEHYHPHSEEFLHVVKGSLTMRLDGGPEAGGSVVSLTAGQGLMVPIGMRHRLENSHDGDAELVFHLSPLAPRPELGHVDTEELPSADEPQLNVGGVR
ncbi:cupin domain-containing protein [Paractinoplanes ferrugineus]|uniref:Cupin n=1 Tax=Paractinoplanes ferrugineus TaxID=113564 RepID=A0A919J5H6_9ACTN|nr:cupin domain-containing protein [Actinoplanes ferrugineus]GIE13717.1 cupin [Actinoplanes ferrugineus]